MVPPGRQSGAAGRPDRPLISPRLIAEFKRERCALAIGEIVHEVGVGGLTVALTVKQARVARATFYDLFTNQEGALRWAIELGNRRLREAIAEAAPEDAPREARVEATIAALLEAAEREPDLIELCLVHGCGQLDPSVGPHDPELVKELADVLGGELFAHGILSLIGDRLWREESESLGELAGQLSELAGR